MTIIRRRHNKNFTVIGNEVFADERLELDALGLLCYLRSRPHDWNISTEHLRRRFGCGPEKMQRLMRELIAVGWIQRHELPRGPRGIYGGFEYVVLDEPELTPDEQNAAETPGAREAEKPTPVPESDQPTPGEPCTAEPESVEPESVNPTAYLELDSTKGFSPLNPPVAGGTRSIEERISEREALAGRRPERSTERRPRAERGCRGAVPPAVPLDLAALARFERLWTAYPASGRLTAGRAEALTRFADLTAAEQETAIRTAVAYAASCTQLRSQAKALQRWLRDGRWRNGELALAPAASGPGAPPQRVFIRDGSPEWDAWAAHYRNLGKPMPTPIRSELNRADGWNFPSALPPAAASAA
ncbi:helix-turn-helix domain-containing protein [Methylobacterium sp. E-066]|uniref:helix-turn-helix domain-containing protein n=1 Tax=Methylobacterium sp. E-066 TaxID=2836584 RepID=UPI001FB9FBF5|nr:helix-turn-helix domain-containing protein [Methylobacterium sp. E-066]MCJ2143703.1 hypothetical protein [Methylobacterium sp. E-066]